MLVLFSAHFVETSALHKINQKSYYQQWYLTKLLAGLPMFFHNNEFIINHTNRQNFNNGLIL